MTPDAENEPPDVMGSATILLVEDEKGIARLVSKVLTGKGYDVLVADSGEEAIEIHEKNETRIDLLLTDVVMPRIGGPQLAKILLERNPGLRVLFMSGYPGESLGEHPELKIGINFLEKPIEMKVLLRKIAERLRAKVS